MATNAEQSCFALAIRAGQRFSMSLQKSMMPGPMLTCSALVSAAPAADPQSRSVISSVATATQRAAITPSTACSGRAAADHIINDVTISLLEVTGHPSIRLDAPKERFVLIFLAGCHVSDRPCFSNPGSTLFPSA
jgi:hypothetical protein